MKKEKFINCVIPEIEQISYSINDDKTFVIHNTYKYKEAIEKFEKFTSAIPSLFIKAFKKRKIDSSINIHIPITNSIAERISTKFYKLTSAEHKNYILKTGEQIKNISKMINFNYANGYINKRHDKISIIHIKEMLTLNQCHFKKIDIRAKEINCRSKIIEIAKLVRDHRRYLRIFNCPNDIDLSYLFFCNAFNSCYSLKNLKIGQELYTGNIFKDYSKQSSKSYYFIFNTKFIQKLTINCTEFIISKNLDSFKLFDSLNYIKLCNCSFYKDQLFSLMQNILLCKLL